MARVTRADLASADASEAAPIIEALAPLATGKNEDGTDFSLPTTRATSVPGSARVVTVAAGTRVKLKAASTPVQRAVVCALATNTGVVVVGDSTVVAAQGTRNAPFLLAGDSIELGPVDLTNVYLDSTVNTEGVTVYYEA